MDHFG